MRTNASESELIFKRWQHSILRKDDEKFERAKPLLIGLGNSTLAMLRQFDEMRRRGVNVSPTVLTHLAPEVFEAFLGNRSFPLGEGEEPKTFTRHPSRLTALSLDIEDHAITFRNNFRNIIGGVSAWNITSVKDDDVNIRLYFHGQGGRMITVSKAHMYALIGYQVRRPFMERLGAQVNAQGEVMFDPITSAVRSTFEGHPNRIYVAGAAANTAEDSNRSVIPGMTTNLCDIAFVDAVKSSNPL